jgi:hypothetical protein
MRLSQGDVRFSLASGLGAQHIGLPLVVTGPGVFSEAFFLSGAWRVVEAEPFHITNPTTMSLPARDSRVARVRLY